MYATDNSIYQWLPEAVAAPASAAEVVALLSDPALHHLPICPRGGGTSTNGQSLTDGVSLDTKRHLHGIISIDPAAGRAVVEPGVVADRLDDELRASGWYWPPHTSTRNRATVGGMIATDAAGKGSLIHGRTHRHVEAVDLVLADGTLWSASPLPIDEARLEAKRSDRIGQIWRVLLALAKAESIGLPELARGFSGYGISRVHRNGLVDPIPIICGSEGTLGVVVAATLRLTRIPEHTTTLVLGYHDLDAALTDSLEIARPGTSQPVPVAIEVVDQTTLDQGRFSPAWPALERHLAGTGGRTAIGAVLLCDFELPASDSGLAALATSRSGSLITDRHERSAVWKVRADAVGLLAKVAHGAPRPTAFVEDCAVPVDHLPAFIAEFRALLDGHGLTYGMFGHADVGCVHVRPALDPTSLDHQQLVATITAEVVALLDRHGGILWGEHGRGLRSSVVDSFLPADVMTIMRTVKTAFDPDDRMNPGKLYRPLGAAEPVFGLEAVPRRAEADRAVPVSIRARYSHAFDCNGNGLCHHYGDNEVMCPSFKITGDPAQSPKGRADLMRAWLHAVETEGEDATRTKELARATADSMATCLSCGACTGRCPVQVDIPELKSRFLEAQRRSSWRDRPLRDLALSRFETVAPYLFRVPTPVLDWVGDRLGLVDLPAVPRFRPVANPSRVFDPDDADLDIDVVILADVFNSVFSPEEVEAAAELLEAVGYRTAVSRLVPTAKFDHVKGRRSAVAKAAKRQRRLIERIEAAGAIAVSIDPAVVLLHRHDYAKVVPGHPGNAVRSVVELLIDRVEQLPSTTAPRAIDLFGHCTEQALASDWIDTWEQLLVAAGHDVRRVTTGCCGMAGVFGHEAEHAKMSSALFETLWLPHLNGGEAAEERLPVATGWSCRSQGKRHGHTITSPLLVLSDGAPLSRR